MNYHVLWMAAVGLTVLASSSYPQDILQFGNLPTEPLDRELDNVGANSEAAQGIATLGSFVFYTNVDSLFRMDTRMSNTDVSIDLTRLSLGGARCGHVGGVDAYRSEIYVAVDKCSDNTARVVVLSEALQLRRSARLPSLGNAFPWVAINPRDDGRFYTISPDRRSLFGFDRNFRSGVDLSVVSVVDFRDHPESVLAHFWTQGGDFSENGLFLRIVDDAKDEDSMHTGVWVYELEYGSDGSDTADRIGFINIRYDPDIWAPDCVLRGQCHRNEELEDLDTGSLPSGPFSGSIHVVMLSNELGQDDVSVLHFSAGDFDEDGIDDLVDNCFRVPNVRQIDLDRDHVGFECDRREVGRVMVPALTSLY